MNQVKIECCLSPALLHLFNLDKTIVVVIDVFRATSTISAALGNGAKEVIPVDDVEACIALGKQTPNSITAGERNGEIAPGLEYGNSPSTYNKDFIEGKTLVLTTTNGTRLLYQAAAAEEILTASFFNIQATADYLLKQNKNVLLACASWKDRFNLEDTLCAGAIYQALQNRFQSDCDSIRMANAMYNLAKDKLFGFLKDSSHFHRLSKLGLDYDLEYCCKKNIFDFVVKYNGNALQIVS